MIFITRLISYSDYNSFSGCDVVVSAQMAPINEGDAMKTHVLGSLQTISYSTHQDRAPVRSIGNINAIDYVQGQRTIAGTMVFAMFHEHWMTPLLEELSSHVSNTDIWSDELPALNLTISMANEYGYKSNMVLYGVKFIDDGGVVSINDLFTENTLQYVATGIQPLKTSGQYEHSYHSKIEPFKISSVEEQRRESWPWTGVETYEKEWIAPRMISVDNSNTSAVFRPFTFHVVIDPPLSATDVIFDGNDNINHRTYAVYITPDPDSDREPFINIFLKDSDDGDSTVDNGTAMEKTPGKDVWYTEVPRGKYDIIIESDEDIHHYIWTLVVDEDNVQNNVTISTDFNAEKIPRVVTVYPVIIGIGETSITTITNTFYDQVEITKLRDSVLDSDFQEVKTEDVKIYDIVSDASIGRSYNKEILIETLLPDTKYSIKSVDSVTGESSNPVVVETLQKDISLQDKLNVFLQTNADILLNKNLIGIDCDTKYEYCNLLDSIVNLTDFAVDPELTLYACVLQNKINNTYNDTGIGIAHKNYIDNLLSNQYNIDDSSEFYTIFKKKQTKNYHILKKEAKDVITYTGQLNTHYYIQPILQGNIKGPRVDFITFTDEQRNELQQYTNSKQFSDLSLLDKSYRYDLYNNDLINAIKAADNFIVNKNMLDAPSGVMLNNTLFVNTDYSDKDIKDDLYLCIADPYESINNFPIIKIPINGESSMAISKFDALLISDSYCLIWIQDSSFNNISLPSIVSTYLEDKDMTDYQLHLIETELNNMSEMFPSNSIYNSYFNTAIDIVLSENNVLLKDIRYVVLQALLLLYEDHLLTRTIDDVLSMIVSICFDVYSMKAKFVKRNNIISFDTEYDSTVISCINISSSGIAKSHCLAYDINSCYDGYTILFLTNDKYNLKSNTLLINNHTKQIFVSNMELEVSK